MRKWFRTPKPTWLMLDAAAVLLGILLTFSFAPYEVFPLAVVAPAGLLALWLQASARRAFWIGFLFGLGMFGAGVYWIFISIHLIGEVPIPLSLFITCGFVAILALFPACTGYLFNRYFPINNTAKILYAFPALWVASEWVRSWLFTGFPWLFLGYSQTNSPLRGIAPLLSVYGISLAIVGCSALIVHAVINYKQKDYRNTYMNLFAIVVIWTIGGLCSLIPWTKPQGNPIPVSLVQGNIAQSMKWSPEHLQLSFDRYTNLTAPLWEKGRIIIWPEAAVPLPLPQASSFINSMDAKAKTAGVHLILGIPIEAPDHTGYYNAVVTLGSDVKVYIKRHLVPFGDYTPFSATFARAFSFMDIPMSNMVPGSFGQDLLQIGNMRILTAVCYEIGFPELMKSGDPSVGFILTVTNDAWFGKSNAEAQHLQMAAMRSLELGRPSLFASNDGITAIIGADGKIEAAAPQFEATVLNGTIQPRFGLTPWMHNGADPILFILICFIFTAVRTTKKELKLVREQMS